MPDRGDRWREKAGLDAFLYYRFPLYMNLRPYISGKWARKSYAPKAKGVRRIDGEAA